MQKITCETPDSVIERTPVSEIPQEIKDYYAKYGYWKRRIPFSANTVKEIARILKSGELEEKTSDYNGNMTFEQLTPFPHYSLW